MQLRITTILLITWVALGMTETTYRMIGPKGIIIHRPPELERTLGTPSPEAGPIVGTILELLELLDLLEESPPGPRGPILIYIPSSLSPAASAYIHFQTAHLAYPDRVDITRAGETAPLPIEAYKTLIANDTDPVDPRWSPVTELEDLILYQTGPE